MKGAIRQAHGTTLTRAMRKKVKVTDGKHQSEPTCDNCGMMTIRQCGSGNHRHCDMMGLYIPDYEMFPTCPLHTRLNKASRELAKHQQRWETEEVTDPEEIARVEKKMVHVRRKEACHE